MNGELKKKILIIDDDDRHLHITRDILLVEGYEVHTHNSPFGATQTVKDIRPDLILLDINMPALSGEKLSQLLKKNNDTRTVPIIFYSSNDEDSLLRSVTEYGVHGYICKGDIFGLKRRVGHYLETAN